MFRVYARGMIGMHPVLTMTTSSFFIIFISFIFIFGIYFQFFPRSDMIM